ncbi:MAG: hypothetical protein D6711_01990 [Chloroflexi bacterium]|nr:MAG: hypothetical protein D6711_01990 [Chloroflexota bacterium]
MIKRLFPIIVLMLIFFYRLAFTDLILARGDTYAYFYPYWDVRDIALAQGELPLWSDNLFMGTPLLANIQLGTLYPPNWLTIPLNAPDSIRVSILLHVTWAAFGAFWLGRRTLNLSTIPALTTAVLFGMGGYISAHVEQINQLQGLAWMPWLFLLLHMAIKQPVRYTLVMAFAWAMQILSGHTQTVFITGVGLGLYGIVQAFQYQIHRKPHAAKPLLINISKNMLVIGAAAGIAILAASPQLIPTQELTAVSNRGGGLNYQQATAFSLDPMIIGRGLLPSYEGQPFGEYIAYFGVIGLGLIIFGIIAPEKRRWVWIILFVTGFMLALGRFNPLYPGGLPGFNLFRVPARWLALFALAGAMLAGLGVQHLQARRKPAAVFMGCVGVLAGLAFLAERATEPVVGPAQPTAITLLAWGIACLVFLWVLFWQLPAKRWVIFSLVVMELWIASHTLPFNDVTDPAVYHDRRFAINQLQAYDNDGRLLSISGLLFDPGDKAALQARWQRMNLGRQAAVYAFTATKLQEIVSGNLPLRWDIPSIDGFDGGVLPTSYYTAFTSLLLPDNTLRTVDGRLRELLAQPACRGVCLPQDRWLDLTHTRYLLTDKVYDLVHNGIFFDTTFNTSLNGKTTWDHIAPFESTGLQIIVPNTSTDIQVYFDDTPLDLISIEPVNMDNAYTVIHYASPSPTTPQSITFEGDDVVMLAQTLVDSRTNDFLQLTPPGWGRIYSADVKIYENLDVMPRAFVVYDAVVHADSWEGTEQALTTLQTINPQQTVVINSDTSITNFTTTGTAVVHILESDDTHLTLEVESSSAGYLVVSDAYYPGWKATVNDEERPILRANVMFRAIQIDAGKQVVRFWYDFSWFVPGVVIYVLCGLWSGYIVFMKRIN